MHDNNTLINTTQVFVIVKTGSGEVVDVVHNHKGVALRVLTYLQKRDGVPMHIKG